MVDRTAFVERQPFYHLVNQAERHPERFAQISPVQNVTYAALLQHSKRLARALRSRGVLPGDLVITDLNEHLNLVFMEALFHEATIAGVHLGPLVAGNPLGVDWLVAHHPSPEFPIERTIVVDQSFLEHVASLTTTMEPRLYDSEDSVCRINFSSGTTGVPTAVPRSIFMMEGRRHQLRENVRLPQPSMSLLRFASSFGFNVAYAGVADGETYFSSGTAVENVTMMEENFVASVQASPTQLEELMEVLAHTGRSLPDLAHIFCGGSYVAPALIDALKRTFNATVVTAYGSTQCGLISVSDDTTESPNVGRPFHDVLLEIVDNEGHALSPDVVGEIRYRTPFMSTSYFPGDPPERPICHVRWTTRCDGTVVGDN